MVEAESAETISQARYDRICKWGILNPPECKKRIVQNRSVKKKILQSPQKKPFKKRIMILIANGEYLILQNAGAMTRG